MFGIKVKGVFLEMKVGASAEVERKSPFFAIDEVVQEKTTPLTFKYTPAIAEALGLPFQYFSLRQKKKFAAERYDGNRYESKCTLVIEGARINMNRVEDSEVTGYVLFGISDFFQSIKGKKLTDLTLGGVRRFNYTTFDAFDGSGGYWQHFHQTWTDNTIPYVFPPVINEGFLGEGSDVDWMNKLNDVRNLSDEFLNPIVPFTSIKYLLGQIFSEHGFMVDFTGLNDVLWEKLILESMVPISWADTHQTVDGGGNIAVTGTPKASIAFSLKDHMPPELISNFLVQLFNKYVWAPVFDIVTRRVRFVAGKELGKGPVKDWTDYAHPLFDSDFSEDPKIFALANDIDPNDEYPSAPDFTGKKFLLPAYTRLVLPNPQSEDRIIYCYRENRWYQAVADDNGNLEWADFADNIYNDEPANTTDTITTTIAPVPIQFRKYRTKDGVDYYGYFPMLKQSRDKAFGLRTLIYHGMVAELNENGGQLPLKYPLASSLGIDSSGTVRLPWSDVLHHKNFGGSPFEVDYGIRPYWWDSFLKILQAGEDAVFKLKLPLHERLNFSWDDRILIKNISYLVKGFIEPVPYTGFVQATLKRLTKERALPVAVKPVVYARLFVENVRINATWDFLTNHFAFYVADVRISLYSDNAGTVPYTPSAPINISVNRTYYEPNDGTSVTADTYPCDLATQLILTGTGTHYTLNGGAWNSTTFTIAPSPSGDYIVI